MRELTKHLKHLTHTKTLLLRHILALSLLLFLLQAQTDWPPGSYMSAMCPTLTLTPWGIHGTLQLPRHIKGAEVTWLMTDPQIPTI